MKMVPVAFFLLFSPLLLPQHAVGQAEEPKVILEQLDAATLDLAAAVKVTEKSIPLGPAEIKLEEGVIIPARAINGAPRELVFIGRGKVLFAPADHGEQGQLDFFTGNEALEESFKEGVFAGFPAAAGLAQGESPGDPSQWKKSEAEALFSAWMKSQDRKLVGVKDSLLRLAAGDPALGEYRAFWVRGNRLGDFLLRLEPQAYEQFALGQFRKWELSETARWKLVRDTRYDMRAGRLSSLDFNMLGGMDLWSALPLKDPSGKAFFGDSPFLARSYQIDLNIEKDEEHVTAKAKIELEATAGPALTLEFLLFPDLRVSAVRDALGRDLFYEQNVSSVIVFFPQPVTSAIVELEYAGPLFKEVQAGVFENASTLLWYPRTESRGEVRYEATFHYPKTLGLVASGIRTKSGLEGNTRWETRALQAVSAGFGFQVGDYEFFESKAGSVSLTLALNRRAQEWVRKAGREKIIASTQEILQFYEKIYGPYPLDHLTVATTFSSFGQGMAGFVTLPDIVFRLGRDFRIFMAHEIAHQWWGNLVTPAGPRDSWLSESIAEYSSVLFGRRWLRKEKKSNFISPFDDWENRLLYTSLNRRPVEWLGPVSLGPRLNSTRCYDCYDDIVYLKGGLALDSLGHFLGEDGFLQFLRTLFSERRGGSLSTDQFFDAFKRLADLDLDWFRRRFIDGVGLPIVFFDYTAEQGGPKGWTVNLHTEQEPWYGEVFSIVKLASGALDVSSRRVDIFNIEESTLGIRWGARYFREKFEAGAFPGAEKYVPSEKDRKEGNFTVFGRATLKGTSSDLTVNLTEKPVRFLLDPDKTVPAQFICRSCDPKNVLRIQGSRRLDAGDLEGAEKLFMRALEAPYGPLDPPKNVAEKMVHDRATRDAQAAIYYYLAKLEIERGQEDQAWSSLKLGRQVVASDVADWVVYLGNNQEARLLLRQGQAKKAYQILWRDMVPDKNNTTEGWALLAIAAKELGEQQSLEKALKKLQGRSVNLDLLR